jgi:hypothetical protein
MYRKVMVIDDNPIDRYIAEITIKKIWFCGRSDIAGIC